MEYPIFCHHSLKPFSILHLIFIHKMSYPVYCHRIWFIYVDIHVHTMSTATYHEQWVHSKHRQIILILHNYDWLARLPHSVQTSKCSQMSLQATDTSMYTQPHAFGSSAQGKYAQCTVLIPHICMIPDSGITHLLSYLVHAPRIWY